MTTTSSPLYWVNQVQKEIESLKEIPLWGGAPPFPADQLSTSMQALLNVPDFQIHVEKQEPLESGFFSLGSSVHSLSFQLSPLPGTLTWGFPTAALQSLTSLLLKGPGSLDLSDKDFQEGFYRYLLLQVCKQFEELSVYPDLHIQWCDPEEKPDVSGFCFEVTIQAHGKKFQGKLFLPTGFQKTFSDHFIESENHRTLHDSASYEKVLLSLRLVLGHTLLSQSAWEKASVGDLVLLDRCTYDPLANKGVCELYWNDLALFTINIKQQNLKILDYAVYHGDTNNMTTDTPPHFSDDTDLEEPADTETETAPAQQAPLLPIKNIPLPVVVELDRISLSLEKLLQLAPGNVLELTATPEQGVFLTVHGEKIARGELIKIGEVLGVKILETGKHLTSHA